MPFSSWMNNPFSDHSRWYKKKVLKYDHEFCISYGSRAIHYWSDCFPTCAYFLKIIFIEDYFWTFLLVSWVIVDEIVILGRIDINSIYTISQTTFLLNDTIHQPWFEWQELESASSKYHAKSFWSTNLEFKTWHWLVIMTSRYLLKTWNRNFVEKIMLDISTAIWLLLWFTTKLELIRYCAFVLL